MYDIHWGIQRMFFFVAFNLCLSLLGDGHDDNIASSLNLRSKSASWSDSDVLRACTGVYDLVRILRNMHRENGYCVSLPIRMVDEDFQHLDLSALFRSLGRHICASLCWAFDNTLNYQLFCIEKIYMYFEQVWLAQWVERCVNIYLNNISI